MPDLWKIVKNLIKELTSTKEKSSKVEKLLEFDKEEKEKLLSRCDELKSEVLLLGKHPIEVSPEVLQKMKDDYLTSEEFRDEKIECIMDGFFQGFNECVRQVKGLDPNFDVVHLRRGDESEDDEEEGEEAEK